MRYEQKSFTAPGAASDRYRENHERIFGGRGPYPRCGVCGELKTVSWWPEGQAQQWLCPQRHDERHHGC